MTSYQKLKMRIAELETLVWHVKQESEYFQQAIWEARKATGEQLGVEPFSCLCGNEEVPVITSKEGLLEIIRGLPLLKS